MDTTSATAPDTPDLRATGGSARRGHWYQLSLRWTMLLVLVVGAGLGLLASKIRRDEVRRRAVAAAIKTGANLSYDSDREVTRALWLGNSINPAGLPQSSIADEDFEAMGGLERLDELVMVVGVMNDTGLAHLGRLPQLRKIYCFKPVVTDAGLAHLAHSTGLRSLELLRDPAITDAGLAHLAGLTDLEELNLSGARISGSGLAHLDGLVRLRKLCLSNLTDEGLGNLGRLAGLQELYFGGTYTDAGLAGLAKLTGLTKLGIGATGLSEAAMEHLAGLNHLTDLALEGSRITDGTLAHLAGMGELRTLNLIATKVSDEGVEQLKRARPGLQVFVNGTPR